MADIAKNPTPKGKRVFYKTITMGECPKIKIKISEDINETH